MHMGMMDTGIPVIISTEQKGILQFNQKWWCQESRICVDL